MFPSPFQRPEDTKTGTFLRTPGIVFILTCRGEITERNENRRLCDLSDHGTFKTGMQRPQPLHLHVHHGLTLFSLRIRQPSCPFIERFISLDLDNDLCARISSSATVSASAKDIANSSFRDSPFLR